MADQFDDQHQPHAQDEVSEDQADSLMSAPESEHEQIHTPEPGELQLTIRAVIVGCLIGGVVGAMNISIGLKIGWSFGGSLIAAILGYSIFVVLRPTKPFSVLETNITQTTGSAAGSMASAAGLLAPIPAIYMLNEAGTIDVALRWYHLMLWALAVGFLGVFFAVPLRRQMVVIEKLRFPTGTATAETIVSIFAEGAEAVRKARVLLLWAIIATVFVLLKYSWADWWVGKHFEQPDMVWMTSWAGLDWLDSTVAALVAYGFIIYLSPVMTGAGLLIGPRIGVSLLIGAILGWGVLGPWANQQGYVEDPTSIMSYEAGVRGWILWPGVAIMVADALTSLALSWRTILNTFRSAPALGDETSSEANDVAAELEPPEQRVPNAWWLGGLAIGSTATVLVTWLVFGIPWYLSILAIILSALLAAIAVRSVGETDINPVGGMGKVTQLAFGGLAPGQIGTNLMSAAITGAGASQAGDMMQDLKTGRMLGASPRRQIIAQCIGIFAGILVVVPIYALFNHVHDIGAADSDYPAPAAHAWKAMAEVLAFGFDELPQGAIYAILGGLALGAVLPIIRKIFKPIAPYTPSGLAMGIAFIVPAFYPIAMFLGSMVLVIWRRVAPLNCKALVFAVASGLIAGEGVMNVVTALMDLARQTILKDIWPA